MDLRGRFFRLFRALTRFIKGCSKAMREKQKTTLSTHTDAELALNEGPVASTLSEGLSTNPALQHGSSVSDGLLQRRRYMPASERP